MALSQFPLNLYANSSPFAYPSSDSFYFLLIQSQNQSSNSSIRTLRFKTCCSHHKIQVHTEQSQPIKLAVEFAKKKRKPRPSFFEQIQDRWSLKISSPREKFPWQEQGEQQQPQEQEVKGQQSSGVIVSEPEIDANTSVSDPVSLALPNRFISAPWTHGNKPSKPQVDSEPEISQIGSEKGYNVNVNGVPGYCGDNVVEKTTNLEKELINRNEKFKGKAVKFDASPIELSRDEETVIVGGLSAVSSNETPVKDDGDFGNTEISKEGNSGSIRLPWKRERGSVAPCEGDRRRRRSNTEFAERMVPEHELRRLRNVALRMLERIKVGAAGITQELVDSIHEKWKVDEVVKLKFEEPHSLNMKRTHEILESKTGGLVIWRSGSSVVVYRGMNYKLHCVQLYTKQNQVDMSIFQHSKDVTSDDTHNVGGMDSVRTVDSFMSDSANYLKDLSKEELLDLEELNDLLDELGPRFKDWTGCKPLPIDADLLPSVVPGYRPPYRLLPYGIRANLRNKEMTNFRRLARTMPPHFALGRNRELQGLAKAMVKLWEGSAIAKIAIKRGVQNTRNERMAEELKRLTGGTLLSRNKDYIVFYRGNDFLPPVVTETLKERRNLRDLEQDEEEQARQHAFSLIESNARTAKGPLVAGTLTETMVATSRWGSQPNSEDVGEMMRNLALTRHASLVRYLEKKLALAKGKLKKAEKALAKVQEYLEPSALPNDLEILSDEERFLFRKIGLSMKPYLLLGRREVYGGTIENMHLHWKYRELVKIIVKGKSLAQIKQIAISLEAESGGVIVSLDKTTKGYAIIVYRGKNYLRPHAIRPKNLLTRRQALARSIELQRREALKHHILDLQERIELLKSDLEEMAASKKIDVEKTLNSRLDDAYFCDGDVEEDEGEEAYLETYDSSNEDS